MGLNCCFEREAHAKLRGTDQLFCFIFVSNIRGYTGTGTDWVEDENICWILLILLDIA